MTPENSAEDLTGQSIDGWILDEQVGASVYLAHHESDGHRRAALKLVVFNPGVIPKSRARFAREAKLLSQLSHPNIVAVRSFDLDGSRPYIEMEVVEGISLSELCASGPVPVARTAQIGRDLLAALEYLHSQGVAHRDVKPQNIMVAPDGSCKLVDFGVALDESGDRLTTVASTFGTMSYTPPEWVNPEPIDGKIWDVYASGVTLWQLLTGEIPFPAPPGATGMSASFQIMAEKQGVPYLDPGDDFPEPLREVIRRMTSLEPNARPNSTEAAALLGDIAERQERGEAPPPPEPKAEPVASEPPSAPARPRRRPPLLPSRCQTRSLRAPEQWSSESSWRPSWCSDSPSS